jgi:alpha-N-arabinofuranosidase
MANIAQSVNVISPLMTTPSGVVKQTTWWPLLLFSKYMRGTTLSLNVRCSEYEGATEPGWMRGTVDTPWLDCSASLGEDGWVTLAVVNVHDKKAFETRLGGIMEGEVQVYTVTGDNVAVTNTQEKQDVGVVESLWYGKGLFAFPKHSLTMLRWQMR